MKFTSSLIASLAAVLAFSGATCRDNYPEYSSTSTTSENLTVTIDAEYTMAQGKEVLEQNGYTVSSYMPGNTITIFGIGEVYAGNMERCAYQMGQIMKENGLERYHTGQDLAWSVPADYTLDAFLDEVNSDARSYYCLQQGEWEIFPHPEEAGVNVIALKNDRSIMDTPPLPDEYRQKLAGSVDALQQEALVKECEIRDHRDWSHIVYCLLDDVPLAEITAVLEKHDVWDYELYYPHWVTVELSGASMVDAMQEASTLQELPEVKSAEVSQKLFPIGF